VLAANGFRSLLALRGVDLRQADANRAVLYQHVDGVAVDHADD
jgi:hypothetical protein